MATTPLLQPEPGRCICGALRKDIVIWLALAYLALPNILFLIGWCEMWISLPLTIGIIYTLIILFNKRSKDTLPLTRNDCLKLAAAILIACAQQLLAGYTGNFTQHGDFWQRNAFYGNLVDYAWPVILPDGRELTYYIASWLPPALLSKIAALCGYSTSPLHDLPGLFLYLWNTAAVILTILVAYCILNRISLLFVFFLFALDSTFHNMILGPLTPIVSYIYPTSLMPRFIGPATQLLSTINHAPATLLATALILVPKRAAWHYTFSGALLALLSPLGAIGLFPFLCYAVFPNRSDLKRQTLFLLRSSPFWISCALLFIAALYYTRAESNLDTGITLFMAASWSETLSILLLTAFVIVFLFYIPLRHLRFWTPLKIALAVFAILPLFYIGDQFNELLFKAILPAFLILSLAWTRTLPQLRQQKRTLIETVLLLALFAKITISYGFTCLHHLPTFTCSHRQTNIKDPLQGHLHHPGSAITQSLPPAKPSAVPYIFYTGAGQSEQELLRWCPTKPCDKYETKRAILDKAYETPYRKNKRQTTTPEN